MRDVGVPAILLKGPSVARWLYPAGGRAYADSDLLVPASEFSRAEKVLRSLGFTELLAGFHPFERNRGEPAAETTYTRHHEAGPRLASSGAAVAATDVESSPLLSSTPTGLTLRRLSATARSNRSVNASTYSSSLRRRSWCHSWIAALLAGSGGRNWPGQRPADHRTPRWEHLGPGRRGVCPTLIRFRPADGCGLIQEQPERADGLDRDREVGEFHRLAHITVGADAVTVQDVFF
jgi:hypothetical protein